MKKIIPLLLFTASLFAQEKVLVFAGSTRDGSFNVQVAKEAASAAEQLGALVTYVDLKEYPIPIYEADMEARSGMPEKAKELRNLFLQNNRIIIASPEYNGSVTALVKNIIDWVSRAESGGFSNEPFKGKKFAIMSASPGGGGGARNLKHLEQILTNLGGNVLSLQVSVPNAHKGISDEAKGKIQEEVTELLR